MVAESRCRHDMMTNGNNHFLVTRSVTITRIEDCAKFDIVSLSQKMCPPLCG